MLLLNLAHPLTPTQQGQIESLTGQPIDRYVETMPQFDHAIPFAEQTVALIDGLGITPAEWQTLPLLVNLPGYAPGAACVLAELHGRMGYFPPLVRLRPVEEGQLTLYEVAEIVNLQGLRDRARSRR